MIFKTLFIGCLLLSLLTVARAEDDIARQIIKSNAGRITVAGVSGRVILPNGETGRMTGPLVSGAILRERMLSADVDDAMRIAYAMELLEIWERNRKAVLDGKVREGCHYDRLVSDPPFEYMRMDPDDVRRTLITLYVQAIDKSGVEHPASS